MDKLTVVAAALALLTLTACSSAGSDTSNAPRFGEMTASQCETLVRDGMTAAALEEALGYPQRHQRDPQNSSQEIWSYSWRAERPYQVAREQSHILPTAIRVLDVWIDMNRNTVSSHRFTGFVFLQDTGNPGRYFERRQMSYTELEVNCVPRIGAEDAAAVQKYCEVNGGL